MLADDPGYVRLGRAIVSVSDKAGLLEFAKELGSYGVEMLATGGTYAALRDGGVGAVSLQDDMGLPSALSGRVKTLHAPLHASILAKGSDEHMRELEAMKIRPVEAVVVNFYPFSEAASKAGAKDGELVEMIDIGGPTMVRAAAKNFERVLVVPSPVYYSEVLDELKRTGGGTTLSFRRRLAVAAFALTSAYDGGIFNRLATGSTSGLPERFVLSASKAKDARYGENPGTKARVYAVDGSRTLSSWKQLDGEEMSFYNVHDVGSAFSMGDGFEGVAAVATVKHGQISGFAFSPTVAEAYRLAHSCDPEADFGGCVVANAPIDAEAARLIGKNEGKEDGSVYTEMLVAPGFSPEALEILAGKQKKKIRVVKADVEPDYPYDVKVLEGAILVQDRPDYTAKLDRSKVSVVTRRSPDDAELEKLLVAWEVVRRVQSNGIVVADGALEGGRLARFWTLGVASFRKRNGAVKIALENAGSRAKGSVCASDGFFPFRDSLDLLGEAGVTSVIQPGGSARDADSIKAADEHGVAMVFTHVRAFRH